MTVQRIWRLTVGGCHGMDPSGGLHECGRVGFIGGRIIRLTGIGLRRRPAVDVPRFGGGRTAAG